MTRELVFWLITAVFVVGLLLFWAYSNRNRRPKSRAVPFHLGVPRR